MLHGQPPFASDEPMDTYKLIRRGKYHVAYGISPAAKDLIRRLLLPNPAVRLGMLKGGHNDVTAHPMCAHIDLAALVAKQLPPPFIPQLSDDTDTSNFDTPPPGDPSPGGSAYDRQIDSRYDELWAKEFD
jgi:serine/threonine protein kinase